MALAALAGCSDSTLDPVEGTCLRDPSPNSTSVQVVPCEDAHTAQVVGVFEAVSGPYPGVDVLSSESSGFCAQAFETFVGSDPTTSVLDLYPLVPSESSWESGDTSVLCVASTFAGQEVNSSFANSHR